MSGCGSLRKSRMQTDEDGTPVMKGMSRSGGLGVADMINEDDQPVFLITIEERFHCKLHKKYNEKLAKYEEEQKELEKKRLEE